GGSREGPLRARAASAASRGMVIEYFRVGRSLLLILPLMPQRRRSHVRGSPLAAASASQRGLDPVHQVVRATALLDVHPGASTAAMVTQTRTASPPGTSGARCGPATAARAHPAAVAPSVDHPGVVEKCAAPKPSGDDHRLHSGLGCCCRPRLPPGKIGRNY